MAQRKERMRRSGLVVVGETPAFQCNVPGCGAQFFPEERDRWQRHVVDCAKANREELHRAAQAIKEGPIPVFDPEAADFAREHGSFMRKPGDRKRPR
jgi:uncharacterized membrane protein